MSGIVRKPVFGVSDQVRHKQSCTDLEMAKGYRLRIYGEGLCYQSGENKDADRLCGYCAADQRLLFSHMLKAVFLMT